jgi:HPt (histidine-containing phosphotransfer) domain-containing protein
MADSAPAETVIDLAGFLTQLDDDIALGQEIVGEYLVFATQTLAALPPALASGDGETARRLIHTLKGASATVYATRMRDDARQLEMTILNGVVADQRLLIEQLNRHLSELKTYLRTVWPELIIA